MGYTGQKAREYNLARVTERRNLWLARLGGKCAKCGSTEQLEFDHIDPSTKEYHPTNLWTRREETVVAELAKCQLLCNSCHIEKSADEKRKIRPHGLLKYKKEKCRCSVCCSAKSAENKLRRRG